MQCGFISLYNKIVIDLNHHALSFIKIISTATENKVFNSINICFYKLERCECLLNSLATK